MKSISVIKPHRGTIQGWRKVRLDKEQKAACLSEYGEKPGLGYIIVGTCIQHPLFGTNSQFHTSWVVKRRGNKIETRNSLYTLGKPYV